MGTALEKKRSYRIASKKFRHHTMWIRLGRQVVIISFHCAGARRRVGMVDNSLLTFDRSVQFGLSSFAVSGLLSHNVDKLKSSSRSYVAAVENRTKRSPGGGGG